MVKKSSVIYQLALLVMFVLSSCTPAPPWQPETDPPRVTKHPRLRHTPKTNSRLSLQEREFIDTVKQYLNVPYKWGGVDKYGMDCSGLVMTVYRDVFDIALPHNSGQLAQIGTPVSRGNLNLGDLVFFRTGNGRQISHVGIYLADSHFVHASSSKGVTISNMATNPYYVRRFVGGRRIITF